MSKYAAEVSELAGKLAQAILAKDGERLLEDPSNFDLEILQVLREVGKKTSADVVGELASRLATQEKKTVADGSPSPTDHGHDSVRVGDGRVGLLVSARGEGLPAAFGAVELA